MSKARTAGGKPRRARPRLDAKRPAASAAAPTAFAPHFFDRLSLAVLAGIAVVSAFIFRDYGLGWDDYTHSEYGDLIVAFYASGFQDTRAFSFVNLYYYGGGFDAAAALLAKISPFDLFETRRLLGAVVGIVGFAATWRLARLVAGPLAGFVALILLMACPMYFGHVFMNPKDVPFAVAMAVLLLSVGRLLREYPAPRPSSIALFGVALGFAVGTRILGLIAVLYVAPAVLVLLFADYGRLGVKDTARRLGQFAVALIPAAILGYALMGILWPWSVMAPLNPLRAVKYFSHFFEKPWKELYEGAAISVPDMPMSYLPQLFFLKLPEVMMVLGAAGAALALADAFRKKLPAAERALLLLVALAAVLPIVIAMVSHPALYNGVRHFLFVLPPFAVLGGVAATRLAERLTPRWPAFAGAAALAFGVGLALPIRDMVRLHPYQYVHFNLIAGGVSTADHLYMLDYWGLAFKQAADELRAKATDEHPPGHGRWIVAVCGPQRVAQVELGNQFRTTADSRGADFALMLGEFYCRDLPAPLVVEIKREDVVFARVYDLRGLTIPNLLTMPPP